MHTILYHRGRVQAPLNSVEAPGRGDGQPTDAMEDMIGAVLRKFGLQERRQQQRRPGERSTERRDAPSRPSKCVNCASEQHATRDCP